MLFFITTEWNEISESASTVVICSTFTQVQTEGMVIFPFLFRGKVGYYSTTFSYSCFSVFTHNMYDDMMKKGTHCYLFNYPGGYKGGIATSFTTGVVKGRDQWKILQRMFYNNNTWSDKGSWISYILNWHLWYIRSAFIHSLSNMEHQRQTLKDV